MAHKVKLHGDSHSAIQGQRLQVNVLGCRNLTDKEWFSRQDPYVIVYYGTQKFQTKTDRDGGKNPTFNERFTFPLLEGLRELKVEVWNKNNLALDDYIGSAVVYLDRTLSSGFDDTAWVLKSKSGKSAGEVNIILHYASANTAKEGKHDYGSAHLSGYPSSGYPPQPGGYSAPGGYSHNPGQPSSGYAPAPAHGYGAPQPGYSSAGYPAPSSGYPQYSSQGSFQGAGHSAAYPAPGGYPPSGYPPSGGYPPAGFPPGAPPPGQGSSYSPYPAAPYPGAVPGPSGPIYGAPPPHAPRDYHGQ